jgi:UDP-glucose 4-epimerase
MTGNVIFITGGAGFIANTVISRYIDTNRIIVYDSFFRDTLSTSPFTGHKNLTVVKGDVCDYSHVYESMRGADIVVHAAGIAGIDTVVKSPTTTMKVNMIGTANVLEAAYRNNVIGRVVDFSTSEVFGSFAFKPTEDSETVAGSAGEARWVYAVSKLAGEHLAMAYFREFALPTVSVRPFNVYGPGQTGEGAIHVFIRHALKNEDIEIHGDGNQIRAWCYVEDFVDCLCMCIEDERAVGESFNIGNARAVMTTYGLAQTVCRVLDSRSAIVFKPALSAEIELRIPSVEKALKVLGFKAKVDLDEGIRKTAEWIRKKAQNPA